MQPTMEDVARKAGVSKSTVSFVLNDKPGVSEEMKTAVLKTAEELGYSLPERRPMRTPQNQQKNFTVIHHVGQETYNNVYGLFVNYLQGIRNFAQQANINITAINGYHKGDLANLETHILTDKNTPSDGLILMGAGFKRDSQLMHRAIELQIPLVVLSRNWPDLPISTVGQNHHQQAQTALDHLAQLGHRKIAFLANKSDQAYEWFDVRLSCYRQKMQQLNQTINEDWIMLGDNGTDATKKLLTQHPEITAIFAIHDERANQAIQGAVDMGLDVPKDISIIGLDGSEDTPSGLPTLTTVQVPHFEVGYLAAELLLRQIENESLCHGNLIVCSQLIKGASCRSLVHN
ncbi:MAG: LacI family DNA-binding transcriptional regulator [Anaerolineae bacterium]|nr:LacI family DNA-binding transcriptional regulator [Anaerolineae bacterium]